MLSYVIRRILATIPVMAIVALFVFSLLYIAPGDPAAVIAGDQATPADVERIRAGLGLDRPFLVRFGEWLWQILHGDLGASIFTNLPVSAMIAQRLEPTLSLMVVTLVFAVSVAVPIGVVAAWTADTLIDRAIMAFAVLGFQPRHPFTYGLISAVPKLGSSLADTTAKLAEIPGAVPSLNARIVGCAFANRCAFARDICRHVAPPLEEKAARHFAACHFARRELVAA
jgi:oligopeptide/dipeptide ABC transporter ATP-binding protein